MKMAGCRTEPQSPFLLAVSAAAAAGVRSTQYARLKPPTSCAPTVNGACCGCAYAAGEQCSSPTESEATSSCFSSMDSPPMGVGAPNWSYLTSPISLMVRRGATASSPRRMMSPQMERRGGAAAAPPPPQRSRSSGSLFLYDGDAGHPRENRALGHA